MKKLLGFARDFALPALAIVVVMGWLAGAFHPPKLAPAKLPAPQTASVGAPVREAKEATVPQIAEAVGAVQAQRKTTIAARVTANVLRVAVSAGQRVRAGELLVTLDDRDLQARARAAKAAVRRAEAARDLAKADYDRDKVLLEHQVVTGAALDVTTMRTRSADADVSAQMDVARDADVALGYAAIKSPYDGIVIDRAAEPGDVATPGKPLLTLYETDRLWFEAAVPEEDVTALRIGATQRVRIDALKRDLEGTLVEIVPSSDPASRTVTARVTLPALASLYPGMFGRLLLSVGERRRLSIPAAAVLRVGQLTMVDLVVGGTVQRRSVQLGEEDAGEVEVLSGLSPRDEVSLSPRKELAP